MSGAHGHAEGGSKKIALLISVLALFLAISETLGKASQTDALGYNVQASNLWSFFQAKTIRQTMLRTANEASVLGETAPDKAEALTKQQAAWAATIARWESEPETQEGRRELTRRALEAEGKRDLALARYHHYEVASASFQIAIVVASASVITGVALLAAGGAAIGVLGIVFTGVGLLAPNAFHLF